MKAWGNQELVVGTPLVRRQPTHSVLNILLVPVNSHVLETISFPARKANEQPLEICLCTTERERGAFIESGDCSSFTYLGVKKKIILVPKTSDINESRLKDRLKQITDIVLGNKMHFESNLRFYCKNDEEIVTFLKNKLYKFVDFFAVIDAALLAGYTNFSDTVTLYELRSQTLINQPFWNVSPLRAHFISHAQTDVLASLRSTFIPLSKAVAIYKESKRYGAGAIAGLHRDLGVGIE